MTGAPVLAPATGSKDAKRVACDALLACPHAAAWYILHPRRPDDGEVPACNRCIQKFSRDAQVKLLYPVPRP